MAPQLDHTMQNFGQNLSTRGAVSMEQTVQNFFSTGPSRAILKQSVVKIVEIDTPLKISDVAQASSVCTVCVLVDTTTGENVLEFSNQARQLNPLESASIISGSLAINAQSSIIDGVELGQDTICFVKSTPKSRWLACG